MLHDPARTSATCLFMGHSPGNGTYVLWSGSGSGPGASPSETATVPATFRVLWAGQGRGRRR